MPLPSTGTRGAPTSGRLVSLDELRAVAVLLVIGRHLGPPTSEHPWVLAGLETLRRGGWVGVDLFFVLSGFLVGGLLFREHARHGRLRVGRFLIRRGLKIYPPFYAMLLVTLLMRASPNWRPPRHALLGELLYLQNYLGGLWSHTWSLAVEEHFYLLLPLLLLPWIRAREPSDRSQELAYLPRLVVVSLFVLLFARLAHTAARPTFDQLTHLFPTHLRADGLMFGVLLAWLGQYRPEAFRRFTRTRWPLLLGVGIAALVPPFLLPLEETPFIYTWGLTTNYLGGGCIVLAALGREDGTPRRRGLFAFVGLNSYSIYLWHIPVKAFVLFPLQRALGVTPGSVLSLTFFVVLSCAAGILAARTLEFPVLRLRDRFFPSRSGALISSFAGEGIVPLPAGSAGPEAAPSPPPSGGG